MLVVLCCCQHKKTRLSTLSYCRQDYVCRGFNEDKTKLGSLPPVLHPLCFFIISPPILHPLSIFVFSPWLATIFYCVTNLFSCVIKKHVSFASHNHNPYTRSYRGTLRMYLWYFKKKRGECRQPRHKNTCRDQICVATTKQCRPKVPTVGCCGDMLPTCWQLFQPRLMRVCGWAS